METVTQAHRENPIRTSVQVKEEVPTFSDSIPVQSRTFSDSYVYKLLYLNPKSEYNPQCKVEAMSPLYLKTSSDMPYKPFLDNPPMQSSRSFEDDIPMSSPFRSSYAQEVYDKKWHLNQMIKVKRQM